MTTETSLTQDPSPLENVFAIRRRNLNRLLEVYNKTELAQKLGYANVSFISQMTTAQPDGTYRRQITERSARKIEQRLELKPGWMDKDQEPKESATN